MHRAAAMPRVRSVPRLPRAAVWALAVLALLVAVGLWFRDSSLVAVQRVSVVGLTGPEATRVANQLQDAALDMTTLHVRGDQLRAVVDPYPVVKDLRVSTDFPHGLKITVIENTPVAAVVADGATTAVAADPRLLRGAAQRRPARAPCPRRAPRRPLPIVPMRVAPGGDRIVDAPARTAIAALAAAPAALR